MNKLCFQFLLIISVIYSCGIVEDQNISTGDLILTTNDYLQSSRSDYSRTVFTPDILMIVDHYQVIGNGPTESISDEFSDDSFSINGLEVGDWNFKVDAYNTDGDLIGEDNQVITIIAGELHEAEFFITPLQGEGSLNFTVTGANYDGSDLPLDCSLMNVDDVEQTLSVEKNTTLGEYSLSAIDLPVGYYILNTVAKLGEVPVGGRTDVIRVLSDSVTTGDIPLVDLIIPDSGDNSITIDIDLNLPLDVTLTPSSATLSIGETITFTGDVDSYTDVTVKWYINGVLQVGEEVLIYNLSWSDGENPPYRLGTYQVDLIVISGDGTKTGAASALFTIE